MKATLYALWLVFSPGEPPQFIVAFAHPLACEDVAEEFNAIAQDARAFCGEVEQ